MAVFLSPIGNGAQYFTTGGLPLNGGFLNTYQAGTTTPQATFTTNAGNVANPVSIPLGTDGRPPAEIWLAAGIAYKFVLTDSLGAQVGPPMDNITGIGDFVPGSTGSSLIGWIQSGIGAVIRFVQDKLRDTVSVKDFLPTGYVTDGSVDYTAYIQNGINELYSRGGGNLDMSGGRWLVDSADLDVKQGVFLKGTWEHLGEQVSNNFGTLKSAIVLNSAYTVRLSRASGVRGLAVIRKGMTPPTTIAEATALVASFAGTGITVGSGAGNLCSDTYVGHCLILGFNTAYRNDFNERPVVEYVWGDCTNGLYIARCHDIGRIHNIHFWPYLTTHNNWSASGPAGFNRSGIAYYLAVGGIDDGQMADCFSFGYQTGYQLDDVIHCTLRDCLAENYTPTGDATRIGFMVNGQTLNPRLLGCKAAGNGTGIVSNLTGGNPMQCVTVQGCDLWDNLSIAVDVQAGRALINSNTIRNSPTGVNVGASALVVDIDRNFLDTVTTPWVFANATVDRLTTIGENMFRSSTDTNGGRRALFDQQFPEVRYDAYSAAAGGTMLRARLARGSASAPTISQDADAPFRLTGQLWDGTQWGAAGLIRMQAQGAPAAGSTPGTIIVSTTPSGAISVVDRWEWTNGGDFIPLADIAYSLGTSALRMLNVFAKNFRPGAGAVIWTSGTGTPEAVVTAPVGSLYTNTSGGAGTTLYVKESGVGNTGWIAK